jgi:hypothetical protein
VNWPYEVATPARLSTLPELINKVQTISEDQLTLIADFFFPDSWNFEVVQADPTRQAAAIEINLYMLENGITRSYSIDDVDDI